MPNIQTTPSSTQENIPTRLNNPGDLRDIGQVGATSDSSGFASFPDPKTGYAALLNDVQSKINKKPNATLADFANTYAPPSDGNNSAQYTANLANKLGVPPNTTLSSLQPKIGEFAEAIGNNEGYKDINSNPNPTSQEVQENNTKAPLSTFDKIALGFAGVGLGAGAIALGQPEVLPEAGALTGEALGADAASTAASGSEGILSKIGTGIKNAVLPALGLEEVGGVAKGLLGSTTPASTDTGVSGQEEAAATQHASEAQTEEEESLADEAQTEKQISDAKSAQSALMQSLQTTPTGKILAQAPQTQNTLSYMAQNGYLPNTQSGYNDYSEASTKADDNISEMSQGVEQVLKEEGGRGQLSDAVQEAYANIDKYVPTHERASAKQYVDELAQTYNETYGKGTGTIGLHQMEQGKREQYKAVSKWDATRPSAKTAAHRSFAKGLRSTIEKNTKHKDLYNRVMKEEQKIFDAKKIMKKMNGKKALEHKGFFRGVLKAYGKYVGTYIGDKIGGPIGAIVGTMVGDHITKSVDKRFGKTYFESKEGKKLIEIVSKKSPHIAKTLKKELKKYGIRAEAMEKEKQHQEELGKKREEYLAKKKEPEIKSPYEPYKEPGIINFGKKVIPKKKKPEKGLPTIR